MHGWERGGTVGRTWATRARSLEPACARRCHPATAAHCSGHMLTAGKQTEWRVARAWQCAGGEPVGRGKGVGGDGGCHCGAHAHAHPVIGPCPITVGPAHLASSSRCGKKGVVGNGGARKGQRRTRAQTSVCTAAPTSHTTMANVQRQPSGRPPRHAGCAWTEECARHTRGAAVVAVETGEWCSAPQAAKRGALTTILYHVVGTAMLGHAPPRNGHRGGLTRR